MTDLGMIVPCPICADAMTIPILSHTEEAVVLALPALERALAMYAAHMVGCHSKGILDATERLDGKPLE